MRSSWRAFSGALLGAAFLFSADSYSQQPASGQSVLFNGRDLTGWSTWLGASEVPAMPLKLWGDWPPQVGLDTDPEGVYSVVIEDGAPALRISGETWGALISKQVFTNYHLQLQYKWGDARFAPRAEKPRNTGLLYHSNGPYGAFWSYWMRSVEFEIMEGSTGDFTSVDGVRGQVKTVLDWSAPFPWQRYSATGGSTGVGGVVFRVSASADYEVYDKQWNTLDLFVLQDGASHYVNGHRVLAISELRDDSGPLTSGRIQLQSEGAEVFFRNITVRPISALPTTEIIVSAGEVANNGT